MSQIKHVAIIMDGNGRWGIKQGKTRNFGHENGIKTVEMIIKVTIKKKIKFLTLFAFSTENWKRPQGERNFLFKLLEHLITREVRKDGAYVMMVSFYINQMAHAKFGKLIEKILMKYHMLKLQQIRLF